MGELRKRVFVSANVDRFPVSNRPSFFSLSPSNFSPNIFPLDSSSFFVCFFFLYLRIEFKLRLKFLIKVHLSGKRAKLSSAKTKVARSRGVFLQCFLFFLSFFNFFLFSFSLYTYRTWTVLTSSPFLFSGWMYRELSVSRRIATGRHICFLSTRKGKEKKRFIYI